ncbi:MAG: corrinoid protein [Halanaerobiaceae bacterium]
MAILEKLNQDLKDGDVDAVKEGVGTALEEGITPRKILNKGLLQAMNEIGKKFSNNEIFVPEVLIAARAMNAGMEKLKPKLIETGVESQGQIVLGTVAGDLHDIGKNLVRMMMEGAGFEVRDLGTDVSPEEFVAAIKETEADILAMSALLTTTMTNMEEVIEAVKEEGLRDDVYIMIGGAPITDEFARDIGADAYAKDAAAAARKAREVFA